MQMTSGELKTSSDTTGKTGTPCKWQFKKVPKMRIVLLSLQ